MVVENIQGIIQDFFVNPILNSQGYNLVNTLVFAVILIAVAFYVILPFLKHMNIEINARFAMYLLPYIVLGIAIRVMEDSHIIPRSADPLSPWFYTFTPGIWIAIGGFTILSLLVAHAVSKKTGKEWQFIFGIIGAVAALPVITFNLLRFQEVAGFFIVIATLAIAYGVVIGLTRIIPHISGLLTDNMNKLAVIAQLLDGSATFTALQFLHCGEQHVVSDFIIQTGGPIAFLLVKLLFVVGFLYYLDRSVEDARLKAFIKLLIIILGFATGLRDVLTLGVGTCGFL